MPPSLRDRIISYQQVSNFTLTSKLPIVITLNGRSFRKITSLIAKPYSEKFIEVMGKVLIKLASDIEGAIFLYSFNDEIHIVIKNDQNIDSENWYNNNIQKMVSASASLASITFLKCAQELKMDIIGDPVFLAKAFVLPNITEIHNYLIFAQHQASQVAIEMACHYELLKKYDIDAVLSLTKNKSVEEKYDLLFQECKTDLQSWPMAFWRGFACYRAAKMVQTTYGLESKLKLTINTELPFFSKNPKFLSEIIK